MLERCDDVERAEVTFDRLTYPNAEAHLFTAGDAALWTPCFSDSYDVVLRKELSLGEDGILAEWSRLLSRIAQLATHLADYRNRVRHGDYPSVIWAHTDRAWHRREWSIIPHPLPDPEDFIHYVDVSIRSHILTLNELGFGTMESCSGLKQEHTDRDPYWPYVMFDERSYPGIAPHLFTLADMASWVPTLAPHSFDVYLKVMKGDKVADAWDRLIASASTLYDFLASYRNHRVPESHAAQGNIQKLNRHDMCFPR